MKCVALSWEPRNLNHSAPPKGCVPDKSWKRAEAPLSEGELTPSVMEKAANGLPVQAVQPCHPVIFWMSGKTLALLGVVLPGADGDIGLVLFMPGAAACPPHPPANGIARTSAPRDKNLLTVLCLFIRGTFCEWRVLASLPRSRVDAGFLSI